HGLAVHGIGAHLGGLLAYGARTSSHPWGRQACARGRSGARLARSVRGTTPFGDDVRRPLVGRAVTGSPVRFYLAGPGARATPYLRALHGDGRITVRPAHDRTGSDITRRCGRPPLPRPPAAHGRGRRVPGRGRPRAGAVPGLRRLCTPTPTRSG